MIRVVVVLCIVVLNLLAVHVASAQVVTGPTGCRVGDGCDQGAAYSMCLQGAAVGLAEIQRRAGSSGTRWTGSTCNPAAGVSGHGVFEAFVTDGGSLGNLSNTLSPSKFYWAAAKSCSARPDLVNARYKSAESSSCSGGCAFAPVLGGGETYGTTTVGGDTFTRASRLAPTGQSCSSGNPAQEPTTGNEDQCVQQGTLTQCVKSDGTICTGKNKQFCFKPGESGIKTSGNEAASNVPDGKASKVPPVPPANGGDWEKIADALVKVSETKGGTTTTNNSTINNYGSSYGSSGSGASGNGAAGQSNGGSGDGSGSGNGSDGDGDGEDDGAGSVAPVDELYKKSDKTVESVMSDFYSQVQAAPIMGGISSFMTVPGGGSCPVFSLSASKYWQAMTYDGHCSGNFLAFLHAAGYVILAIAAYFALRIAVT